MWYGMSNNHNRFEDPGKESSNEVSFINRASKRLMYDRVLDKEGTVPAVKKAEKKRTSLLANLGDLNRPLRVRPVRVLGREWWAIDAEDIWPGMVMDLRRLGFESIAWGDEVLVREGTPAYEFQMDGPAAPGGLKPFPSVQPTIRIRKESYPANYSDYTDQLVYLDEDEDDVDEGEDDAEFEPEDLDNE
jgi:hypothetical protein